MFCLFLLRSLGIGEEIVSSNVGTEDDPKILQISFPILPGDP